MSAPLRVAVVGAGAWGREHARVVRGNPSTRLVAIAGRTSERTSARAAEHGVPGYTDLQAMIQETEPELITVCLPNEGHFEATYELLGHGIPLLVEKPLVFDLEEGRALLARAEQHNPFFTLNFNHRFAEPVQRAKVAIDAGDLGTPIFATWRFGGEANHGTSPHANLIETQCHGFDMLEHLLGPIGSVSAHMTDKTYGDYSTLAIALTFTSGAVGTMLGTYDSSYSYPDSQLIEVGGTAGRLTIHDTVRRLEISRAGEAERRVWEAGYFDDEARSFHRTFDRHLDALLVALRDGATPPVPARDGYRALELAHACIRSFESGRRVDVPAC